MKFILNEQLIEAPGPVGMAALDFIRSQCQLKCTKEGCREGDCGACTVLVGRLVGPDLVTYQAVNSCLLPLGELEGGHLVTLEGLNQTELTPPQRAIVEQGAAQCGYCTPGIVVALTGYLLSTDELSRAGVTNAIAGNICRCTGYEALQRAASLLIDGSEALAPQGIPRLTQLIDHNVVPLYFARISCHLARLSSLSTKSREPGRPMVIGGGTDVMVQQPAQLRSVTPRFLGREGLDRIDLCGDTLQIGVGVTYNALAASPEVRRVVPRIEAYAALWASDQIRNRATVGGNIVNGSPIGDLTILLLALHARLQISDGRTTRSLPLDQLFKGYKSLDLRPTEIIERIDVPLPSDPSRFNFEKVSKRTHLDIASVNSAMTVTLVDGVISDGRLSAGGVAPVPMVLHRASAAMVGRSACWETADAVCAAADREISPISDIRGSAAYKRVLLQQLVRAHFHELFQLEGSP